MRNAAVLALFPLGLAGCLAALDFDGIAGPPADGGITEAGDGSVVDGGMNDAAHADAGGDGGDGDGAPKDAAPPFDAPPICDKLTMLMRFEGSLTSAQGVTPTSVFTPGYTTGKYGQAMVLNTGTATVTYPGGGTNGPNLAYPQGTISAWVAASGSLIPCPSDTGDSLDFWYLDQNGPGIDCFQDPENGVSYIANAFWSNGSPSALAEIASSPAPWVEGRFNHVVATWSQSPAQLTITVNGVSASSGSSWSQSGAVGFLTLGSSAFPGRLIYDDLAVWTRALSAAEIATIYGSSMSMGDVCGLPR